MAAQFDGEFGVNSRALRCLLSVLVTVVTLGLHQQTVNASDDAIAAIEKLGGSVRTISLAARDQEVDFRLVGANLTDADLVHVTQLKNVVSIDLSGTKITNAGLIHLKGLVTLRRLHLEKTEIGDEGIAHLTGLVNLEYLNLYSTKVTDKSLGHIAGLKNLKRLYLWQTKTTDAGADNLEKKLPELEINRGIDFSKLVIIPSVPLKPLKWIPIGDTKLTKSNTGSNVSVTFENKSARLVKLYWMSYEGKQTHYGDLKPGEKRVQNTYASNYWLITDEKEKPLGYFTIGEDDALAVIPK